MISSSIDSDPRAYSVDIGIRSQLGIIHRMKEQGATTIEQKMFHELDRATARYQISYVEYTVARNIENCINDWFDSENKRKENPALRYLKVNSRQFALLAYILPFVVGVLCMHFVSSKYISDLPSTFSAIVFSAMTLVLLERLCRIVANSLQSALDEVINPSVILLGKADRTLSDEYDQRQEKGVFRRGVRWLMSIPGIVIVSWLADLLLHFLTA